jgi:hypothetical protein
MSRQPVGQIELRREGLWWVGYYNGSTRIELARVLMHLAEEEPQVKEAFVEFMKTMVGRVIAQVTGRNPTFDAPHPAPRRSEH